MSFGWDFNIGNVIGLGGLILVLWKMNRGSRDLTRRQHEENLVALTKLIVKVDHLDDCIEVLKKELRAK